MKFRIPLTLLSALLASVPAVVSADDTTTTASSDLGNVMFVGDSITHGVNSASYRWALHKILVDNGISYSSVGVNTGNYSNGVTAGTVYGGVAFNNEHSSQSSARAWEISGRKSGTRFSGSNIYNWLGLSDTTASNSAYTGSTFTDEDGTTPDTFFLMIGTNDLISDYKKDTLSDNLETVTENLLGEGGDMDLIVQAMLEANENAAIYVLSIPCWTAHTDNNADATHQAVAAYNSSLEEWANKYDNVTYININTGLIDVASSTSFYGVESMFNNPGTDGVHPNAQGDLIIAGNIAKALGYAGRSAGQTRVDTSNLAVNFYQDGAVSWSDSSLTTAGFTRSGVTVNESESTITLGGGETSSITYSWADDADLSNGFTLDLNLTLGDGSTDGWNTTDNLSVYLGTDSFYGLLNINEAYIQWGDTVLYSMDMSQNTETLRVAYVVGNSLEGLNGGYYVWLGDMLIGEALSVTYGDSFNGLTITYSGSETATLSDLALDGTASYAPSAAGIVNEDSAYIASSAAVTTAEAEGILESDWEYTVDQGTNSYSELTASGTYNARAASGVESGNVGLTISSGSAAKIYANSGDYQGDVWLTIDEEGKATDWYGAHGGSGTLDGNVYMRFTDDAVGGSTVFGAVNANKVTGNVYLEFSAENAAFDTSFTKTASLQSSVVGAYATDIGGDVDIVINSGSFTYQIMGGIFTGSSNTIGGDTNVYINGGSIESAVMGGGLTGIISGSASVTVTDGTISADVYGAGAGGAIGSEDSEGGSSVSIKGGTVTGAVYGGGRYLSATYSGSTVYGDSSVYISGGLVQGDIHGGGSGGTINGDTSVTIEGNTAQLYDGAGYVTIYGASDSSNCSITGSSTVTIKNLYSGTSVYGFDKYTGTIVGGASSVSEETATLILDSVTVSEFGATLTDFTAVIATGNTNTTLTSLGGAATLTIDAGSSLTVSGDVSELTTIILGSNAVLTLEGLSLTENGLIVDISEAENYTFSLDADVAESLLSSITFTDGVNTYAARIIGDDQATSVMIVASVASVPEPGSAALALSGALLSLLWRRREKSSL